MFIDQNIKEVLDLDYILEKINPVTPYGKEYKKAIKPYPVGTESYLQEDLDLLEAYVHWYASMDSIKEVNRLLHSVKDIRFSLERAVADSPLSEIELYEIKIIVFTVKRLCEILEYMKLPKSTKTDLIPMDELEEILNPKGQNEESFYLYDVYSERLSKLRKERSGIENDLRLELRSIRKDIKREYNLSLNAEQTVNLSKQDDDGIERAKACPKLTFQSETFNGIIFSLKKSEDMLETEAELEELRAKEFEEEIIVRRKLSRKVAEYKRSFTKNIFGIGNIDLLLAKAKFCLEINGVKPEIVEEHRIEIVDGIYPKVKDKLELDGMEFTPISISLEKGVTCITGANMGGKTITLKIVGLLAVMAQMGLFVPAKKMVYGLNKFIRSSIGDFQSTSSGLSTFGGEIENVNYAIRHADERSLILIDELARGTNPQEGYAISLAIAYYLQQKNAITLLTTHFDQITKLDGIRHLQVVGLSNVDMDEVDLQGGSGLKKINQYMDYRLKEVSKYTEVPKDAIRIAHMMGLPIEITNYAIETLKNGR